jgi:DNA-binding CsgD family transcriptional regulator
MFTKQRNAGLQAIDSLRGRNAPQRIHLTRRQRQVLALLCEGLPNKVICRRLDISAGTAKAHISVILRELGVCSRLQAVIAAHKLRIIDEDEDASDGGHVVRVGTLERSIRERDRGESSLGAAGIARAASGAYQL